MQRFVVQIISFFTLFLVCYSTLVIFAAYSIFFEHQGIHNYLYSYQVDKIRSTPEVRTVFIGDSSLGNALNSEVFTDLSGQETLNLALTGSYGYAGSYNMLKKTHRYHPEMRNVVVMHTPDMPTRGLSFEGYAKTITSIQDILELPFREMKLVLRPLFNLRDIQLAKNYDYSSYLSNDYVRQNGVGDFEGKEISIPSDKLNRRKDYFLKKIVDYCDQHQLNLIYVHGPFYEESVKVSKNYLDLANEFISTTGVNLITTVIAVPNGQLGDTDDHINPANKEEYTRIYYHLISPHLGK